MANTALQVLRTATSGRIPNTTATYATNSAYIGAGGLALNMTDNILFSSNGTSGNLFTIGQNCYTYYASNGLITIKSPSGSLSTGTAARSIYTGYGLGIGGADSGTGTGFGVYLNLNQSGNKQLVFADPDNLLSNVIRISVISGAISIDSLNFSGGGTSANVVFGSGIIVQQGVYANDGNPSYFSTIYAPSINVSANLTLASGARIIDSTASQGTAGQVLTSNGTGNVYWSTVSSGSTNVAAQYTWTNTQTFSNTITFSSLINTAAINVVNQVNTATLYATTSANVGTATVANATGVYTTGTINAASHTIGTTFIANTTSVFFGNSTSNATLSATSLTLLSQNGFLPQIFARNSANDAFGSYWNAGKSRLGGIVLSGDDLGTFMFQGHDGNTFVNSSYLFSEVDGSPVANSGFVPSRILLYVSNTTALSNRLTINSTATSITGLLAAGNTTITGFANVTTSIQGGSSLTIAGAASGITTLAAGNTTITGFANVSTSVNTALLTVGATFTANATLVNAAAVNITGQVNTATFYATTSANVGGNVQLTTSSLTIGNSTVNVFANSSVLSTAAGSGHNFTMLWNVSTSSLDFTYA